jgi:predicted ArsR family transcriptional regulator
MPIDPNDIESIALLDEPVRRVLYEWVIAQTDAVGRDEAAKAVGIARALAAFHLDRLAHDGLLVTEFRRLTGRTGPGAGRPAKLYRRAQREIDISLPQRRYEAAARMMASALERAGDDDPPPSVRDAAHEAGLAVGGAARREVGSRAGKRRRREALLGALRERGYEPREAGAGEITLGNCPYHALVHDHRDLVCGMNLAWAKGVLEGVGETDAQARLDSQPGRCCVVISDPPAA